MSYLNISKLYMSSVLLKRILKQWIQFSENNPRGTPGGQDVHSHGTLSFQWEMMYLGSASQKNWNFVLLTGFTTCSSDLNFYKSWATDVANSLL